MSFVEDFKQQYSQKNHGLSFLANIDLPYPKTESWKYTNLTNKLENYKYFEVKTTNFDSKTLSKDFKNIVLINGDIAYTDIDIEDTNNLSFQTDMDKDFLYQLANTSNKNITLRLKDLDSPILIHHKFNSEKNILSYRINIVIEKSNDVELLEVFDNECDLFANTSTNIYVEENSHVTLTQYKPQKDTAIIGNSTIAKVEKNSTFKHIAVFDGAQITRSNIDVELLQEGASTELYGLYQLKNKSHHDSYTIIKHSAPHTYSTQLYKGVMDDESRGIFTGTIKVDRDSQKIESTQLNKNLLLTPKAKANSRPQLEIFADDVKCAHGSTTAQLDEEQLFYFTTRCIDPDQARELLSSAFINEILFKISNPIVKNYITDRRDNYGF